jgi:hypothetical protein
MQRNYVFNNVVMHSTILVAGTLAVVDLKKKEE